MTSAAEQIGSLIGLLFSCGLLAFIPLAFGVGYGSINLFNDYYYQQCLSDYQDGKSQNWYSFDSISTEQPSDLELGVLNGMAYFACVLVCCTCCIAWTNEPQNKLMCIGGVNVINAFIGSCLFMHVYHYLHEIDSKIPCMQAVDGFDNVYNWSIGGVVVGSIIVALTTCFCCCGFLSKLGVIDTGDAYKGNGGYPGNSYVGNNYPVQRRVNNQSLKKPLVVVDETQNDDPMAGFDDLTMSQKHRVVAVVSLAVVEECGFLIATENNRRFVMNKLYSVQPSGQTALRDAVFLGVTKLLQLKVVIARLGAIQHKFVHIVLTDGVDNKSSCTLTDAQRLFLQLGRELGDLCTTFFIGVGLGHQEKQQLQSIANLAGDAAELYHCEDVQLKDVFDRIKIRIGIQREIAMVTDGTNFLAAHRDQLYMTAERQKFLVLFTLDKSGSMNGRRWTQVCSAVAGFMQGMGESDIIGCVLFNDRVICITD